MHEQSRKQHVYDYSSVCWDFSTWIFLNSLQRGKKSKAYRQVKNVTKHTRNGLRVGLRLSPLDPSLPGINSTLTLECVLLWTHWLSKVCFRSVLLIFLWKLLQVTILRHTEESKPQKGNITQLLTSSAGFLPCSCLCPKFVVLKLEQEERRVISEEFPELKEEKEVGGQEEDCWACPHLKLEGRFCGLAAEWPARRWYKRNPPGCQKWA